MLFCPMRNAFRLYEDVPSPPDAVCYSCVMVCAKLVSKGRVFEKEEWLGGLAC